MTIRRLINLTRRVRNPSDLFTTRQSLSTAVAAAHNATLPSPPPPTAMVYDRLADSVKEKLKKLEDPDPRFLKYNSPHPTTDSHAEILASPPTRVTTLPNGFRIATESNLASKTATVGLFIDAGSRFESEESNGLAHLLEHVIFRDSTDRISGHLNAYTSREQTAYYNNVIESEDCPALFILADIIQRLQFEYWMISRAKDGILHLIEEIEGRAEEVVFDHLHATAFQHTPLGRTILGPAENIERIRIDHLRDYIATHYTYPRMVVAASGAVEHEDIVRMATYFFDKVGTDPTTASDLVAREPAIFTGSEVRMLDDDQTLAKFAVAFEGASWTDPDLVPLMVMQYMLGSWNKSLSGGKQMGSELVQRVAINEIADSVMAFNINYKDTGLFGVYAVAKPDCLDDLSYAIMHEMTKLCYRVTEADVIRARNQLKSSLLLSINGNCSVAVDIGRQLLAFGRRIPYPELVARIDAVDASTIKRVANRFIFDRDIAIAAVGPIQGLPDYNWFRRRTYWLRY